LLLAVLAATPSAAQPAPPSPHRKVSLNLGLKELTEPLRDLSPDDRRAVDLAIASIERGEHAVALAWLSRLSGSNPMNSSVRVLRAYALLELGNLTGALDDARAAEASPAHSAYQCWFLAQVAYLAGNKPLCRREIKHLAGNTTWGADAEQLRRDLQTRPR